MESLKILLRFFIDSPVSLALGILLSAAPSSQLMGQAASDPPSSVPSSSNLGSSPVGASPVLSPVSPSSNAAESSLFYFLNMSGRKQADFKPLTSRQRVNFYAKGLFGPFMFLS